MSAEIARLRANVRLPAFAALIAALGLLPPIPVPIVPVPITAQTLGVMLAGLLLGARGGAIACVLFLVLVALGFPLLAGGRGGLGVFAGPSAGFLLAWPVAAATIGFLAAHIWRSYAAWKGTVCALVGGIGVMYVIGIPWVAAVAGLSLPQAAIGAAAFLPGDFLKAVLAGLIVGLVRRGYPALQP